MGFLGSILVAAALGSNTASFPQVNLNVVAITVIPGASVVQVQIDPTRLGTFCSDGAGTSQNLWTVFFQVPGQQVNFTQSITAGDVIFYYGDTPLSGSAPLNAFIGVFQGATAAGATNLTFTFPSGVLINGMRLVATSASGKTKAVLTTGTTYTLTLEIPGGYDTTEYPIVPISNVPSGTSLVIPVTLTALGQAILVLYYQG